MLEIFIVIQRLNMIEILFNSQLKINQIYSFQKAKSFSFLQFLLEKNSESDDSNSYLLDQCLFSIKLKVPTKYIKYSTPSYS